MLQSNVIKENRLSLWYNKYLYKAVVNINGVYPVKYCKDFLSFYERVDSWGWHDHNLVRYDKDEIMAYYDWVMLHNSDKMLVISGGNKVTIFGDDLLVLNSLVAITGVKPVITEAVVYAKPEKDVKYFNSEPKHKYRVYLNSMKVDDETVESLHEFIGTNPYYPCLSLKLWVTRRLAFNLALNERAKTSPVNLVTIARRPNISVNQWTSQSFFIDYDEEDGDVSLHLKFDSLIHHKSYRLAKKP